MLVHFRVGGVMWLALWFILFLTHLLNNTHYVVYSTLTLVIHRDTPLRSGGGGAGPVRPCSYCCLRALTAIAAKPREVH